MMEEYLGALKKRVKLDWEMTVVKFVTLPKIDSFPLIEIDTFEAYQD